MSLTQGNSPLFSHSARELAHDSGGMAAGVVSMLAVFGTAPQGENKTSWLNFVGWIPMIAIVLNTWCLRPPDLLWSKPSIPGRVSGRPSALESFLSCNSRLGVWENVQWSSKRYERCPMFSDQIDGLPWCGHPMPIMVDFKRKISVRLFFPNISPSSGSVPSYPIIIRHCPNHIKNFFKLYLPISSWFPPCDGFLSHRGTPSHHPFRTMGFSLLKTIHLEVPPWLWNPLYHWIHL